MKKKILVGLFVFATVVGIAFAGTRYIRYSCGHTEAVGSVSGKDKYDDSSSKCPACQKKERDEMCNDSSVSANKAWFDKYCSD